MSVNVSGNVISSTGFDTAGNILNNTNIVTDGLVLWLDAGNLASYNYVAGTGAGYYDCGYGCQYYSSNPGCTNCNTQIKDMSGFGNDGTLTNGAVVQYSNIGGSVFFDKTDDYVNIGSSSILQITTQISIFSWINLNNLGTWNGIFGALSGGAFVHFQTSSAEINIYIYGPSATWPSLDSAGLTSGTWLNIGFTFDGTTIKVFKNGAQFPTTATAATPGATITTTGVSLGRVYDISRSFGGNITSNLVYNRALSAAEVLQNFNADRSRFGI